MSSPPIVSPMRFPRNPAACGSPTVRAIDFSRSEMTSLYSTMKPLRCGRAVGGYLNSFSDGGRRGVGVHEDTEAGRRGEFAVGGTRERVEDDSGRAADRRVEGGADLPNRRR